VLADDASALLLGGINLPRCCVIVEEPWMMISMVLIRMVYMVVVLVTVVMVGSAAGIVVLSGIEEVLGVDESLVVEVLLLLLVRLSSDVLLVDEVSGVGGWMGSPVHHGPLYFSPAHPSHF
jgi:hypothetical protein